MSEGRSDMENLEKNRDEIRQHLLPQRPIASGLGVAPDGEFPRSALMRALLDPRHRWVWVAGATVAMMLAPRLRPVREVGRWVGAYQAVRRSFDRR